jgi:hypothetical protein
LPPKSKQKVSNKSQNAALGQHSGSRSLVKLHRVTLSKSTISSTGLRYAVTFNGETTVMASLTPLCAAARVLRGRGIVGSIELWDSERPFPRMSANIAHAAALTVEEGSKSRLRFRPWKTFPAGTGSQKTAKSLPQVRQDPPETDARESGGRL